ncbi:hypothetical protein GALMADRAFT_137125 [Galerina marginata CBS 339.88]|uniref:Uncharacterized protein n=1 Tax=Galerina marginata (strain CBS 339.88) TaxID=685588 RepID=A0A067TH52_GALM3|nr:hypothetical protein GALMADRAFT_137125 [Galerina marginata CBS 339.88]
MLPSSPGSESRRKPTRRSSQKKAKERKKHRKLSHIENEYFFNTFTDRLEVSDPDPGEGLDIKHDIPQSSTRNGEYLPSASQFPGITQEVAHALSRPRAFDSTISSDSAAPQNYSSNSSSCYLPPYAPDLALQGPNNSSQNFTQNQLIFTREDGQPPITQHHHSDSYLPLEYQVPNSSRPLVQQPRFMRHESNLLEPHSVPLRGDGSLTTYEGFSPATRYPYSFSLNEPVLEEGFNMSLAPTRSSSSYYFMPHSNSQNTSRESLNLANTIASGTALRHNHLVAIISGPAPSFDIQGSDNSQSLRG